MLDIIGYSIVIGMVVNTVMTIPLYAYLDRYGKPFSCSFCMAWWCCVIIGLFNLSPLPITQWLIVTLSAPYCATVLERIKDALPIRLK